MTTCRLENILDKHIPENQEIDFMSIDVEGMDLQALKSNNWDKYRPFIICVETHGLNLNKPNENTIYAYLTEKNYKLVSHNFVTSFFMRN